MMHFPEEIVDQTLKDWDGECTKQIIDRRLLKLDTGRHLQKPSRTNTLATSRVVDCSH
jgi:hypothetical protein